MSLLSALTIPSREPAECVVTVDGQEITTLYPFLAEVTVETNRKAGWTASLKLETRRNPDGTWVVEDAGVFVPWAAITIQAVFGQSTTEEVFRGYVKQVKADYPESSGAATVTVSCLDQSMALDRKHERKEWGEDAPGDDKALLSTIAGTVGIAPHKDNAAGCDHNPSGLRAIDHRRGVSRVCEAGQSRLSREQRRCDRHRLMPRSVHGFGPQARTQRMG